LLAGCAIHPLPEDVTRETSYQIVQKIRCEAREALTNLSVQVLRKSDNPRTLALADRIAAGELTVTELFDNPVYRRDVDPKVHRHFNVFALSAVAWDFSFTGLEKNNNSANAGFRSLHGGTGTFTLGLKGGANFERQNERQVQFGDTFLELDDELNPEFCADAAAGRRNFVYPITGKIGLQELFDTFVVISSRDLDPNSPGGTKKFADVLSFKTTFTASADPKIVLSPGSSRSFRLVDASASVGAERTDTHKLTIAISMGRPVTSLADARRKTSPVRQSAAKAKQQALRNLDELKTDSFFATQRDILRRLDELQQ
jgi:hypothetical protein